MTRGTLKSQCFRDKIEIFIRLFDEHFVSKAETFNKI